MIFAELGIVPEQLWTEPSSQFNQLHHYKTMSEIKDWMKRICEEANRLIYETRKVSAKQLVEQAKVYIQEQFEGSVVQRLLREVRHMDVLVVSN